MHSFLFKATTLLLAPILAVKAVETGFLLVDKNDGGASIAITDSGFDCGNLENPWLTLSYSSDGNTFHVSSDTGNICGVAQWDAYKDCDTCTNYGLYVAGGDGTKQGYCYPVSDGGRLDQCYSGFLSVDYFAEYMYCDIWNAPSVC
jgi:hypothetical protein